MAFFEDTSDHFVSTVARQFSMPAMHYHNSYELYYLEAGSREYFVEDKFFSVSAGDFVLIAPNKFHRTGGAYSLRTIVGFTYEYLAETYTPNALKDLLRCFDKVFISPPESMQEELKGLLKSLADDTRQTDFAVDLATLLRKLSKCTPDTAYDERISNIIKYINKHFSEIHSIDQIAEQMHVSKHHLCRVFKDAMGITMIDYLNHIRVKNACNFLESSDKDMLEISQLCGFNSSAYFGNVFKKITGCSPLRYRKEYMK